MHSSKRHRGTADSDSLHPLGNKMICHLKYEK